MLAGVTGHDAPGPDDAQPRPGGEDGTADPTPPPSDEPEPRDDTAPLEAPLGDTADQDETAPLEPAPGQAPGEVGPTGTAVLPPVPDEPDVPPRPRWAGRASVSAPPEAETYGEPGFEEPRSIVVPVLITVCVMLLVAVFVVGAWLILSNRPGPAPSPTATQATSAAPTPTVTTGSPTATPTGVTIPALTGLDYDAAASILSSLGLTPERRDEFDEAADVGQVLRTEPAENTLVPPGATVTVVVSRGPQPAPTTTPPTSPAPTES